MTTKQSISQMKCVKAGLPKKFNPLFRRPACVTVINQLKLPKNSLLVKQYSTKMEDLESSKRRKLETNPEDAIKRIDAQYFEGYSHIAIHETMLKDSSRTLAYKNAIMKNEKMFKGKTVMDLGCGTGVLSIFSTLAGAKKVYGIEASKIGNYAELVIKSMKLEKYIEIVKNRIENLKAEDLPKVDILISECMGYALLYESMFDALLDARDKFLKPDGVVFPNEAKIYIAPITNEDYYNSKVDYWKNVYGLDFSALIPYAKECAFTEPLTEVISSECLMAFPKCISTFDLKTVTADQLKRVVADFEFPCIVSGTFNGFALWFDVSFKGPQHTEVLSTSPDAKPTHWFQTLFYVDQPIEMKQDDVIKGSLVMEKNAKNVRGYDFTFKFSKGGENNVAERKWSLV